MPASPLDAGFSFLTMAIRTRAKQLDYKFLSTLASEKCPAQ